MSEPLPVSALDLGPFVDTFVIDVLDALGLERAHVVAFSFGVFLTLRAADRIAPIDRMVQMACSTGHRASTCHRSCEPPRYCRFGD